MSLDWLRELQLEEVINEKKPQRYNTTLGKNEVVKTPVNRPNQRADSDIDTLIDDEWV